MYWLSRPRYLRPVVAAIVVAGALYVEFRPQATARHPFAAESMAAGEPIDSVEWRSVPAGLFPQPDLAGARAAVDIGEGEPLLPSHVSITTGAPADWWSLPVPMSFAAPAGTRVQLVDAATGTTAPGVVVAPPPDDPFIIDPAALIAVPPESAGRLAVAAAAGEVTVLIE